MTSPQTNINQDGRLTEQLATIRFSHVDFAGAVFYPRYFELLGDAFPALPIWTSPFAFDMRFVKPNRLGDRIRIVCECDQATNAWSFSGRIEESEHFSIRMQPATDRRLRADAHRPAMSSFRAEPVVIGAWASGGDGVLQVPRYFELISGAVEQWFGEALDLPFHVLHTVNRNGIPTVRLKTRCHELPRLGTTVQMWLRPTHVGRRSVRLTTWLVQDKVCVMETEQIIVFVSVNADGFRSREWPDELRRRMRQQLEAKP